MSVFWDHLYFLLMFLIAAGTAFGVYRVLNRRLSAAAGSQSRVRPQTGPLVRPGRARDEEAEAESSGAVSARGGFLREELRVTGDILGGIFRELRKKNTLRWIAMDMLVMIAISTLLAMFSNTSIGGLNLYMTTYLPMMGVMLVLFAFTEATHGNRPVAVITAVLILTGVALQGLLQLSDKEPSATQLVVFAVVSMTLAIIGCFVLRMFAAADHRKSRIFLNGLLILIYLVLAAAGTEIYGTKAWLVVGGFSFQLTELTKVVTLMIYGVTFTDTSLSGDKRMLSALFTLAVNGGFLVIVNELGTLCILGLTFFVMGFMYLPDLKGLAAVALALVVLACAGLFVCSQCSRIEQARLAAAEEQTQESLPAGETVPEVQPAEKTEKSIVDKVIGLGAKIWRKFKLRVDLVIAPETVDPLVGGYQSKKAQNALMLSSWLGSIYEVDIPVVESDYIYTFLVLKMGVVYGVLILLMMLVLLACGLCGSLENPRPTVGAVGAAFTLGMVLQSLIAAASAIGAFITVGLPFSFLSDGGTAAVTNYLMAVFIIYAGSPETSAAAARIRPDRAVRRERTL